MTAGYAMWTPNAGDWKADETMTAVTHYASFAYGDLHCSARNSVLAHAVHYRVNKAGGPPTSGTRNSE